MKFFRVNVIQLTLHVRPPPISDRQSQTSKFFQSKPYSWNPCERPPPVSDREPKFQKLPPKFFDIFILTLIKSFIFRSSQ